MAIVFFGSGPVAAASLQGIADDFEVELVITKSKPPHHRGEAPVEEFARQKNLKIAFANTKAEVDKILKDRELKSPLGLIIDYGVIVSETAINKFACGIVNSHFSLLPQWRGADPITYSILSGQKTTGVSLMIIQKELDEGMLLAQAPYKIAKNMTAPELTEELIELSNQSLKEVLPLYAAGKIQPAPQDQATMAGSRVPSYSHKINKSDGIIDWSKPAERIEREIRAYAGWPGSRTRLGEIDCLVTSAEVINKTGKPGNYDIEEKSLIIYTGEKALKIKKIKPAGKNEMNAAQFLNGYKSRLV